MTGGQIFAKETTVEERLKPTAHNSSSSLLVATETEIETEITTKTETETTGEETTQIETILETAEQILTEIGIGTTITRIKIERTEAESKTTRALETTTMVVLPRGVETTTTLLPFFLLLRTAPIQQQQEAESSNQLLVCFATQERSQSA